MSPGSEYLTSTSVQEAGDPGAWGAHDPTVVRAADGRFLMFSTDTKVAGAPGAGVQIRQSSDLLEWTWLGHAFDGVPAEAADWSGAHGLWAPEVVRRDGEYRMYYSASSFGSRTSAIALATARNAAGPWQHRQIVVATHHDEDEVNAIDAAVVVDAQGDDWLLYGSFFGGLRILPLAADGRPASPGDQGTPVVQRPRSVNNGAVEGGHILFDEESGRYALFCSFDSLFDTYNVRVAVADEVRGPYRDAAGEAVIEVDDPNRQVGTIILTGYIAPDGTHWAAPGHSSHLVDGEHRFLVHHVRDGVDPQRHTAHVRRLRWTRGGIPLASPLTWGGCVGDTPAELAGEWLVHRLDPATPAPLRPESVKVSVDDLAGLGADGRGQVRIGGTALDAVLFVEAEGIAVAGLDERSVVVWGIRA